MEPSRREDIALQPALDLCCNPQVFYGFLQYFALWFLQCCFVIPLGLPGGGRWNRDVTETANPTRTIKKRVRVFCLCFLCHKEEIHTHSFSLNLNFSRTEALLLIKCLLWCVLYQTPAISGSVAILKSFFWAHALVPVRSSQLPILYFHPRINIAKRLFDYHVEK